MTRITFIDPAAATGRPAEIGAACGVVADLVRTVANAPTALGTLRTSTPRPCG